MRPLRKGCLLTDYYGNISTSGMQECAECWARRAEEWVRRAGQERCAHCTGNDIEIPDTKYRDQAAWAGHCWVRWHNGDKLWRMCQQPMSTRAVSHNIISDEGQYDVMIRIFLCLFCTCVTVKLSTSRIMKPVTRAVTPIIRHAHGLEFYKALYCWGRWDFRPFVLSLHHQHERESRN